MARRLLFLLLLICLGLAGCANPQDDFIQGRWANGDVHSWSEWVFDRGGFTYQFSIDVNHVTTQSGMYRIYASDEDLLILELFNTAGRQSIEEQDLLRIEIDRQADALSIQGRDYYRVFEASLRDLATSQAP
jgi:hypothetical protein